MKFFYLSIGLLMCFFSSYGQDDLLNMLEEESADESKKEKVFATFKGVKLVNANTIETVKKKTLEFRIAHRFGNMDLGNGGSAHTFYGFDNASNIRYSFDFGLTDTWLSLIHI